MLHNMIVPMRVYSDVSVSSKAEIHDDVEYTMSIRKTCHTMDNMIRLYVIKPLSFIDFRVGRLW